MKIISTEGDVAILDPICLFERDMQWDSSIVLNFYKSILVTSMTHRHSSVEDWFVGAIFDIEKTQIFLTTDDDERQSLLIKVWHRERECFECVRSVLIFEASDCFPTIDQVHQQGSDCNEHFVQGVLHYKYRYLIRKDHWLLFLIIEHQTVAFVIHLQSKDPQVFSFECFILFRLLDWLVRYLLDVFRRYLCYTYET